MGYLDELRSERTARHRPTAPRTAWSDHAGQGHESRSALEDAGVLEAFDLLKEKFRFKDPSLRVMSNGATRSLTWDPTATHRGGSYTQTYKKVSVDLTPDGDFLVRGRDTQTILRAEHLANPNAVTDALRRAVENPELACIVSPATNQPSLDSGRRRVS